MGLSEHLAWRGFHDQYQIDRHRLKARTAHRRPHAGETHRRGLRQTASHLAGAQRLALLHQPERAQRQRRQRRIVGQHLDAMHDALVHHHPVAT